MKSYLDVMNLWGSDETLAGDLGWKVTRVQKWRARRRIPPKAWPNVLDAAKRRGIPIDAETLMNATDRKSAPRRESRLGA